MNNLFVGALTVTANAVAAARFTLAGGKKQGIDVVFHVQPIPHIQPVAVERIDSPPAAFRVTTG